jgi:hypothetical protein
MGHAELSFEGGEKRKLFPPFLSGVRLLSGYKQKMFDSLFSFAVFIVML